MIGLGAVLLQLVVCHPVVLRDTVIEPVAGERWRAQGDTVVVVWVCREWTGDVRDERRRPAPSSPE